MYSEPLTVPTEPEILEILSNGDRQTPANVAAHLDRNPQYMSQLLRILEEREYIRDAPPADRSGMWELTDLGAIAAFHIHTYVRGYHDVFHAATETILNQQPENASYPDLIVTDDPSRTALFELQSRDGLIVPSELHIDIGHDEEYATQTAGEALYSLYYHGLAERVDEMDVYRITDRGEKAADLPVEELTNPVELTDRLRETYTNDETERLRTLQAEMA